MQYHVLQNKDGRVYVQNDRLDKGAEFWATKLGFTVPTDAELTEAGAVEGRNGTDGSLFAVDARMYGLEAKAAVFEAGWQAGVKSPDNILKKKAALRVSIKSKLVAQGFTEEEADFMVGSMD